MPTTITIGQTLDGKGQPIPGTGVTLAADSPTAQLLRAHPNAVMISNPITREYGAALHSTGTDGVPVAKGLGIIPPGSLGPPEHIHPAYEEIFEVVEGQFTFWLSKKPRVVSAGDTITVPPGVAHTFRPVGDQVAAFLLEARPAGQLNEVIRTIFGLAHDGQLDKKGRPGFWQGIAIGNELRNDTLFTSPSPAIQRLLFKLLGKTAAKKGYQAVYPRYVDDAFWRSRVQGWLIG
jgi:mannose-6-phosphate isomerase-like protein (cupin superfamily)